MVDSRLGEIRKNNKGTEMKIIAYRKGDDIDVEFLDEHHYIKEHSTYQTFKLGQIKNPFDKITFGHGYLGTDEGIWNVNTPKVQYNTWKDMIERCCVENTKGKFSHYYDDVSCCEEWLCYKNFDEWYQKNVYEIGNERMHLDKDIKYRGNKVYSPYHCILVPQSINEQFRENRKIKDADLPYTIHRTTKGKYSVAYRGVSLGTFDTVEESEKAYVTAKRENIKTLVAKYDNMPDKVKQIILNAEIR